MSNMGVPRSGPFGSAPFTTPPLAEIATQLRLTRDPLDGWYVLPNGIRFHPDDTTFYKYSVTVLKENPKTFVPDQRKRNPTLGVTNWGLIEHPVDRDLLASFILRQGALDCYDKKLNHNPTRQFIKILEQRKIESVNCERVQSVLGHALIVRIELCENESDVWRTFRVPASIDLSKLHDQVIVPVMGWSRCKKGYVFEDPRDGTVLGIHASKGMYYGTADSLVAADMDYHYIMDDRNIPLAILLREIGDVCYYTYDLGEQWVHRMIVEDVVECNEDYHTSACLINGAGACPPEDGDGIEGGRGCLGYAEFLRVYKKNPKKPVVREALKKIKKASNHTGGQGVTSRHQPHTKFDPFSSFHLDKHKQDLEEAVAGPSLRIKGALGSTKIKERKAKDVCEACGDPLKVTRNCGQCLKVSYCSRDCQLNDWKRHKKVCKNTKT